MRINRRRFFGAAAGALCTVMGVVYGAPFDVTVEDSWWQSEISPPKELTEEYLNRCMNFFYDKYVEPGMVYVYKQSGLLVHCPPTGAGCVD